MASSCIFSPRPSSGAHGCLEVLVQLVQELPRRHPGLVGTYEQRQVLGHLAGFDRVDAHLLQPLGELLYVGRAVELASIPETARPGIDRGDRIGGCLLALLVLAEGAGAGPGPPLPLPRLAGG